MQSAELRFNFQGTLRIDASPEIPSNSGRHSISEWRQVSLSVFLHIFTYFTNVCDPTFDACGLMTRYEQTFMMENFS